MICGYLACSFDLLNVGDLDVIAQARDLCDHLTVGVYSDACVELRNGRPAVVPLSERLALVRHVRGVDAVVVHEAAGAEGVVTSDRIFLVDDEMTGHQEGVVRLTARRSTSSRELLDALAPTLQRGVA